PRPPSYPLLSHCRRFRPPPDLPPSPTRRSSDLASDFVIVLLSPDFRIREWNPAAENLLEDPRKEVLEKNFLEALILPEEREEVEDRKSTRLNYSHVKNSYAVFCLKKKYLTRPRN